METVEVHPAATKRLAFVELETGRVRPAVPRAPLCSSCQGPWSELLVEEYVSPPHVEQREVAPAQHHLLQHGDEPAHMELKLDGGWRRFVLHRGQFLLCPAQVPLSVRVRESGRFLSVALDPARMQLAGLEWGEVRPWSPLTPRLPFADPFLTALIECLRVEMRQGYPGGRVYGDTLAAALMAHLWRSEPARAAAINGTSRGLSRSRLRHLDAFMREHLAEDLSLATLAREAGLSPFHFVRVFKQTTGQTPHRYLLARRLERARQLLLQRTQSLAEVALTTGFCDQSHLTLHFKRAFGLTPGEFRRRRGGEN